MKRYSPQEFASNPGKFTLYKTASVAAHFHTENGRDDLTVGQTVSISYRCTALNRLFRRTEPVYAVSVGGRFWGDVYANTLADFCL